MEGLGDTGEGQHLPLGATLQEAVPSEACRHVASIPGRLRDLRGEGDGAAFETLLRRLALDRMALGPRPDREVQSEVLPGSTPCAAVFGGEPGAEGLLSVEVLPHLPRVGSIYTRS